MEAFQAGAALPGTGRVAGPEWAALQGVGVTAPTATPGEVALAFAEEQLGDTYTFGSAGPDKWDCSGLTMKAWAEAGVTLPHSSAQQYKIGKEVKKAGFRPGDLVFFYSGPSHVGIYVGRRQAPPRPGLRQEGQLHRAQAHAVEGCAPPGLTGHGPHGGGSGTVAG